MGLNLTITVFFYSWERRFATILFAWKIATHKQ